MKKKHYYTDYPIPELGDTLGVSSIREVEILAYDGDKYCRVLVEGVEETIKSGYIYTEWGICGEVPVISGKDLESYETSWGDWQRGFW